jgi:hypothetical protein
LTAGEVAGLALRKTGKQLKGFGENVLKHFLKRRRCPSPPRRRGGRSRDRSSGSGGGGGGGGQRARGSSQPKEGRPKKPHYRGQSQGRGQGSSSSQRRGRKNPAAAGVSLWTDRVRVNLCRRGRPPEGGGGFPGLSTRATWAGAGAGGEQQVYSKTNITT